jgi:MFS transporter, ACS family, hexuronate transporter
MNKLAVSSTKRWMMISLAFFATVINYLDRQTLSVSAPVIRQQFHISNTQYSRILFGFLLAYTIMNGVSGILIDRLGTRVGYALCMAWWSASAVLHAFATGPISFGVYRFLLGMGEAGNWPAAVKVVAEWFPVRERALASGIFNSGSAVGAIIAPPLIAITLIKYGWPVAFLVVGSSGFVWLIFWFALYRTPEISERGGAPSRPSMLRLFRLRFVWCFTLAKVFMDPVWYFYIFWFPEYLSHTRHFNISAIGKAAWIPFAVAGAGNGLGGLLSKTLLQRGLSITTARKTAVTITALMMTAAIPAVLASSPKVSIAFVSIAMAGYTASLSTMLVLPSDVFPANVVASVYGISGIGSGFGGMLFVLLTGWLVDHYSYTPVFFFFGLIPLVCALVLWTCMGPLKMHTEESIALTSLV